MTDTKTRNLGRCLDTKKGGSGGGCTVSIIDVNRWMRLMFRSLDLLASEVMDTLGAEMGYDIAASWRLS